MVFHCIFRHFAWSGTEGKKRADDGITIQERMRDLSCDIAVEHMIDGMNYRSIRFSRSLLRRETYRLLEKEGKTLNAQRVYKICLLYTSNLSAETPVNPKVKEKSCPDNCGLCEEHERKGCCMILEVTKRCRCV